MRAVKQPIPKPAARLDAVLEAAVDGIIVIDADGYVQTYNRACERIFGHTAAEVIGRNVAMLMPAPDRERHDTYIENYRRSGVRKIIGIGREVTGLRKNGTTFPMELSVAEVRQGEDHAFVGIVRDVSERQQAERRLQELQAQLVHVSRVSAMGAMASAFAHELSQPLGAAMNYLNAVRRWLEESTEARAPRMREGTERAVAEVARAGQIIQRLRQFIQKGHTERAWEKLGPVIEEAAALALVGAADRAVKIRIEIAPDLPAALIDKVQIQQVLTNLIRNAVEAMAASPKRDLTITCAPTKAGAVEIAVKDTGPGIAPEVAKDLFKPFVTTKSTGMGVGLSICRSIVQSHGGELRAEANPSGGSVFRFTLPLKPADSGPNV